VTIVTWCITIRDFSPRRRTQVVKGADCKSVMRRFESGRRLHFSPGWSCGYTASLV
jgi:hypothetical protein